jgi:hypothetical protein
MHRGILVSFAEYIYIYAIELKTFVLEMLNTIKSINTISKRLFSLTQPVGLKRSN